MARKKKIVITIKSSEIRKKVRSPFANTVFTGCGAHKSEKDFNRQKNKLEDRNLLKEYK